MSWSEKFHAASKTEAKAKLAETTGVRHEHMPKYVQAAIEAQIDALPDTFPTGNVAEVYTYGHVNAPPVIDLPGAGSYHVSIGFVSAT